MYFAMSDRGTGLRLKLSMSNPDIYCEACADININDIRIMEKSILDAFNEYLASGNASSILSVSSKCVKQLIHSSFETSQLNALKKLVNRKQNGTYGRAVLTVKFCPDINFPVNLLLFFEQMCCVDELLGYSCSIVNSWIGHRQNIKPYLLDKTVTRRELIILHGFDNNLPHAKNDIPKNIDNVKVIKSKTKKEFIGAILNRKPDIIVVSCHQNYNKIPGSSGVYSTNSTHQPYFSLSDREEIHPFELEEIVKQSDAAPLLLLNICSGARVVNDTSNTFLQKLNSKTFAGIITTIDKIDTEKASLFSQNFLREFLVEKRTLEQSLLLARVGIETEPGIRNHHGLKYAFWSGDLNLLAWEI
jgi:hypothetical protein